MGILSYFIKHFTSSIFSERGDFGGFGGDKTEAEQGIAAAGNSITDASKMSDQEKTQYQNSFGMGQNLQSIYSGNLGLGPQTGATAEQQYQQQGPLAQNLYNTVSQQVQNPYAGWESSLQPNLQLATNNVNQQANTRGLLNSGIDLQNLGTAGVEAAVADAQGRMQYGQQAIQNAATMSSGINQLGQQNVSNYAALYGGQQATGLSAMQRQAGGASAAAGYLSYPYQAELGAYYGTQAAQEANYSALFGAGAKVGIGQYSISSGQGDSGGAAYSGGSGSGGGMGEGGGSLGGGGMFSGGSG